jgi:hypothetical protein
MRSIVAGCTVALLISVSGCEKSAEDRTKKQIDLMNDLADAIEKKDEAKAKSVAQELKENGEKLKAMNLSDDDKKKIAEKYKEDLGKALGKLLAAAMKDPDFMKKVDFTPSKQ